jgi:N-acetylmuramoyl-L-alanine amidase
MKKPRLNACFARAPLSLSAYLMFFIPVICFSQRLTPLSAPPDWSRLSQFQETITREMFVNLLDSVYAPNKAGARWIKVEETQAIIRENASESFILRFAAKPEEAKPIPRYWIAPESLPPNDPLPFSGVHIALDPGHLGGSWAKMEERWFQIGDSIPVTEGDLTLRVAQILALRLRDLGAKVTLVRAVSGPVTSMRPDQLQAQAETLLRERGITNVLPSYSGPEDPKREDSVSWEAERLFYRIAEIHQRAEMLNEKIKPDLVICLHFNAEPWGTPDHPVLVPENHLHLLINGAYSPTELGFDDERFTMLFKLLNQTYSEEVACSEFVAGSMAKITGLPSYQYFSSNARSVGYSGYVWARNLLANRLYECPVIYIEPYVMNNQEVFARLQAGEYEGLRNFGGVMRLNIFEEYVQGLVDGLSAYFRATRR